MADTTLPGLLATGDHASRPAASAIGSGGLYSCTDHGLVYQTDGSSWTTWATLGGGGIPETLIDAKGDLVVGSAADTAARLAVGVTNGHVLTVDSGEATGLKWAAAGGGGLAQSYVGYNTAGGTAATPAGNNSAFATKVTLAGTSTILSVGAYVAMASLAGTVPGVAIYADSGGSPSGPPISVCIAGRPGESGIVWDTPTTAGWLDMPISKTLAAGDYWLLFTFMYQATSWRIYYDSSGSDKEVTFTDTYYIEGITYRASLASAGRKYSIRASILS